MTNHVVKFQFNNKNFKFKFKPDDEDWWTAFKAKGMEFDVHYCEDYNQICVYQVINNEADTSITIHSQPIKN